MEDLRKLCDARSVALRLGVSKAKVYLMMEQRELPYVQIGTRRLVLPEDVERYIADHRVERCSGSC